MYRYMYIHVCALQVVENMALVHNKYSYLQSLHASAFGHQHPMNGVGMSAIGASRSTL